MKLSLEQAIEVLENPQNKQQIDLVKNIESKLRVFTETMELTELVKEPYWSSLNKTIRGRIGDKKYEKLKSFMRFPLPVVDITDSIIGDYYKVFDGKNKYFNVDGNLDTTRIKEWIEEQNIEGYIESHAKEVFKNKPCSFVVIDTDSEGVPKPIFVDSNRIVDAKPVHGKNGDLEYIAFMHSVDVGLTRYAVYDDENYYVFYKEDDSDSYILDTDFTTTHDIGYCPATLFVREKAKKSNPLDRRVAFSSSTAKLEDWVIFDTYRNYLDHYAPFPVTESPKKKCGNQSCENGVVMMEQIVDNKKKKVATKCPICDGHGGLSHLVGPGTNLRIKHTASKDVKDASGIFRFITPDTKNLEYTPKKLDDLETEIKYKTVGVSNILTKEAVNEVQAKGSFLSRETVLLRTKVILDELYKFIVKTSSKLILTGLELKIDANFGTEWYLLSERDLQDLFERAKKAGLPVNEILSIYKQLIETKYANNNAKKVREMILIELQDYPFMTLEECIKLKGASVLTSLDVSYKANFFNLVTSFERDNGSIVNFGANIEYSKKLDSIKKALHLANEKKVTEALKKQETIQPTTERVKNNEEEEETED